MSEYYNDAYYKCYKYCNDKTKANCFLSKEKPKHTVFTRVSTQGAYSRALIKYIKKTSKYFQLVF